MTETTVEFRKALAELGLEEATSEEAIRRAYLRAVRLHPPERDAEGFRRVREAYDLLRQAPWRWREQPPAPEPDAHVSVLGMGEVVDAAASPDAACDDLAVFLWPAAVPVWQLLEEALRSIEAGEPASARALVATLEQRTLGVGVRATELGPPVIARWTLVSELVALEGVATQDLIVALVKAVRSEEFDEAVRLFEAWADDAGWRGRRDFVTRAPNLRKALATAAAPPFRNGFTKWGWLWIGYALFQIVRACTPVSDTKQSDAPDRYGRPTVAWIDEAARLGHCDTVRQQWPYYAHEVDSGDAAQRRDYTERRKRAVAACTELYRELPEAP